MNNIFQKTLLLVAVITLFTACKKEETPTGTTTPTNTFRNELIVGDTTIQLTGAYVEDFSSNDSTYPNNPDFMIFDENFQIDSVGDLIGQGYGIYLDLMTATPTSVANGTYSIDGQTPAGYIVEAGYLKNYTFDFVDDDGEWFDIPDANLIIKSSNGVHEILFSGTTETGERVSLTYKGVIPVL